MGVKFNDPLLDIVMDYLSNTERPVPIDVISQATGVPSHMTQQAIMTAFSNSMDIMKVENPAGVKWYCSKSKYRKLK